MRREQQRDRSKREAGQESNYRTNCIGRWNRFGNFTSRKTQYGERKLESRSSPYTANSRRIFNPWPGGSSTARPHDLPSKGGEEGRTPGEGSAARQPRRAAERATGTERRGGQERGRARRCGGEEGRTPGEGSAARQPRRAAERATGTERRGGQERGRARRCGEGGMRR
jgi:hypothetical protein